jgi:hypothetical protein
MPAQPNLKSASITNLDATPPVRPTAGAEGGVGRVFKVVGIVGPTTDTDTTGGVLRCCRIPSQARVQSIKAFQLAATTTATFDIGLDYSDAVGDGTSPGNYVAGTALNDDMFAAAWDSHAIITPVELAFQNLDYLPTDIVNPIWQAAGTALTSDPGGYFDIVLTNRSTISGAATLIVLVDYVVE